MPGVTAGVGVTAYAGIPVTHRATASAVAFVTGHGDPESGRPDGRLDWSALARFPGTLVVYMGVTHLAAICRTLIREGKPGDTPAAIDRVGDAARRRRTQWRRSRPSPEVAREAGVGPPALLIVGEVVGLRDQLAWYERLPLFGQRIVVTRPAGEGPRAAADPGGAGCRGPAGADGRGPADHRPGPLDAAIDRLDEFDWLVFTSANGVRFFLQRLERPGPRPAGPGPLRLAAIGPATAEALAGFHLRADLVPDSFRSEALAAALLGRAVGAEDPAGPRRSRPDGAPRGARAPGRCRPRWRSITMPTSASLPDGVADRIADGTIDWITLTSSAIAERLHALLPEPARRRVGHDVRIASLSPVTSETARSLGWDVAVEAGEYTWDGLVRSLVERVAADRGGR